MLFARGAWRNGSCRKGLGEASFTRCRADHLISAVVYHQRFIERTAFPPVQGSQRKRASFPSTTTHCFCPSFNKAHQKVRASFFCPCLSNCSIACYHSIVATFFILTNTSPTRH
ncbi:hypothetical protein AMS68_007327 [Peltaster fructicola]|uniref:Uncharacterized protein n=1 Tax=Peltaster fructicola TaxID=286661 RepID=A0A6H0Y5C4_9PEZI|nr:hypothetical protein AMS68_007327 [Peltaster fructicola]